MARWRGKDKLLRRLRWMTSSRAQRLLGAALFEGGEVIEDEAKRLISAGSVSGAGHVPSAPGEPPNYDSGVLSANIETAHVKPLVVEVSSNAPYASPLEFGTSRMAERPYMRPARDNKRKEVAELFARQVNRIAKGVAD